MFIYFAGILTALCCVNVNARQKSSLDDWIAITPKENGKPWPLPQKMTSGSKQLLLDPRVFAFQYAASSQVCELLAGAFNRYYTIIFSPLDYEIVGHVKRVRKLMKQKNKAKYNDDIQDLFVLEKLVVNIENECEDYPTLESDESCS
jgi:hypothetical protein